MKSEEGRIITNNPLRILGVYSDTPKKEIVANLGKLRAFAKTGKVLTFDTDFTSFLGPVDRSIETIEQANNAISLPKDKLQAGMFWFMNHTDNDKAAMECLKSGDTNEAMTIIQRKGNYSGVVNMAVLALILKRWDIALYSYAYLLESPLRRGALVKAFTDTEDYFSEDELVDFISNKLINDFPNAHWIGQLQREEVELGEKAYPFKSRFAESKLLKEMSEKCVARIKKDIDAVLSQASSVSRNDAKANLRMAEQVEEQCKSMLKELRQALGRSDKVFIDYADKIANQILDNCIDYYTHDADNPKKARNVIKFTRYAYRTAESKTAKERAKKNLDILSETLENLMPEAIEDDYDAIDKLVTNYKKKQKEGECSFLLGPIVEEAYTHVQSIKNKVGKENKFYISISTDFVRFAFQEVVKRINSVSNYSSESGRTTFVSSLHWGRTLFDTLARFDMDNKCKKDFDENFKTLMDLLRKMVVKSSQTINTRQTSTTNTTRTSTRTAQTSRLQYGYTGAQPKRPINESKDNSVKYLFFGIALIAIVAMLITWGTCNHSNSTPLPATEEITAQETVAETESYTNSPSSLQGDSNTEESDYSVEDVQETYTEPEPVRIVQYNTGDRPYQSTYGRGNYDSNTQNSLLVRNGSSTDAVVFLERTNGKKVRHVFIEKGHNFTMTNIPGGQYIIKVMQGTDWNADKDNGSGNPKGGFMYSCSISKSESYDPFDYPCPSSGQYGQYEVTLYKVQNGNMQTEAINENGLF